MLFYLFLITVFSFVPGQLGRFFISNGLVIQLTDLFIFITVLTWFIEKIKKRKKFWKGTENYFFTPFILFILIAIISLLVNFFSFSFNQIFISALYLVRWGMYGCIFYIVREFDESRKKIILNSLLGSSFLIILLGYIQYFFYPNLRNIFYLGWDDHLYRLVSTILDPNFAAVIINLLLFIATSFLLHRKLQKKFTTILLLSIVVLSFPALLLTYSRSGYIMFVVGISVLLWIARKKKLLTAVLSTVIFGIILLPKDLGSSGVELWRTASVVARAESAVQAIEIIKDHPILWVGFNTYRYVQQKYKFTDTPQWETSHSGAGTDNSYLFVTATTGIIGLLIYLLFLKNILQKTIAVIHEKHGKKDESTKKIIALALLSSIVGLGINAFFIHSLFFPAVLFWLWCLFGMVA